MGTNGRHLHLVKPLSEFLHDIPPVVREPECTMAGRLAALDRDNIACYQLIVDLLRRHEEGEIDEADFLQDHGDLWSMSLSITEATAMAFDEFMSSR